jgi:RNA recognition motif-containing protein
MTKRIYVGNLPADTTERELIGLFERVGRVASVRIMRDRATGRPKGGVIHVMLGPALDCNAR